MKFLVSCEESQTVCKAFRQIGIEAYSNDILDCSGGHPDWHLKMDAREALEKEQWDGVIAHPSMHTPYKLRRALIYGVTSKKHVSFLLSSKIITFKRKGECKVAIENPIPHKYAVEYIGKYHQLIQPWQFGHGETKATCLWLYGLPKLTPTNIVEGREQRILENGTFR